FLGSTPGQIAIAAQQTLEGVLREVVSQLTPEEVNEDRLKFAETLSENARDDLDKLGLELDVLKVQNVSDEQKYLAYLGRGRIATMLRDATNAENAANQAVVEAQRKAQELKARGEAAPKVENGKAVAEALRLVAAEWSAGGDAAREVYVL